VLAESKRYIIGFNEETPIRYQNDWRLYQATLALTGIARGVGGAAARKINKIPADRP
jgi:hypothetical protein